MAKKEKKCVCPPPGAPGWMTTFADLMSLLMCFFVLLLSFSEIDVMKFKDLSGSLKHAFGVQHQVNVDSIPRGTSIIALEFSPSVPKETILNVVQQETIDMNESTLEFVSGDARNIGGDRHQDGELRKSNTYSNETPIEISNDKEDTELTHSEIYFNRLQSELYEYVYDGSVQVESKGQEIIITVPEGSLFAAGSGRLQPQFIPLINSITKSVSDIPGAIKITGYTDDSFC